MGSTAYRDCMIRIARKKNLRQIPRDEGNQEIDFLIKWKDDKIVNKKMIYEGIVLNMKEGDEDGA